MYKHGHTGENVEKSDANQAISVQICTQTIDRDIMCMAVQQICANSYETAQKLQKECKAEAAPLGALS
jgi:hypothetical protein